MKNKRYVIIDDNPDDVALLSQQLIRFPFLELESVIESIEQALYVLTHKAIDLIFLDIDLNGENGLSLLHTLEKVPPVIIISSHPEYAVDSYDIGKTVDYLLKPYKYDRLLRALSRALDIEAAKNNVKKSSYIFLKEGRQVRRFDLNTIDYIEAYGIYSKVHSQGHVFLVNESLLALSEALSEQTFQRVHKSFLINTNKILRFDRNSIWLEVAQIPVGNAYRLKLDGLFKLFGPDN